MILKSFQAFLVAFVMSVAGAISSSAIAQVHSGDDLHAVWDKLLQKNVTSSFVDYEAIESKYNFELNQYLERLRNVTPDTYSKWNRSKRLAFWINVYNAFTVKLIVDNYPVESILWIDYLPDAVFRRAYIELPGLRQEAYSLMEIERDILWGRFHEPRIHFAIVRASKSSPVLRSEAYRGAFLEDQLDDATRSFLTDSSKNRIEGDTLWLSPIFDWFQDHFESAARSVQGFVGRYLELEPEREYKIDYLEFDWSLNGR